MNAHDLAAKLAAGGAETLNSLLRGELAAVASYDRAIAGFEGQPAAAELHHVRDDHAAAVAVLRERVARCGGTPADTSGPWGTPPAQAVGPATTLKALREGEMHQVGEYEAALAGDALDPDAKDAIRSVLLPRCREHVVELDRLMAGK